MTGSLEADFLDIWLAAPGSVSAEPLNSKISTLTPEEAARYHDFMNPEDRTRFLLGRWMVRAALSHYHEVPREAWEISGVSGEKPRISNPAPRDAPFCEFNLSYSGHLVALAISSGGPLGIDVEPPHRGPEALEIARRRFTRSEKEMLESLEPETRREEMALWMWTAKEAVLKALGKGLSAPLTEAELSGSTPETLRVRSSQDRVWSLLPFQRVDLEWHDPVRGALGAFVGNVAFSGNVLPEHMDVFQPRREDLEFTSTRVPVNSGKITVV